MKVFNLRFEENYVLSKYIICDDLTLPYLVTIQWLVVGYFYASDWFLVLYGMEPALSFTEMKTQLRLFHISIAKYKIAVNPVR